MNKDDDQSYELKIRILGNEVLALSLSTTSTSSRWVVVALASMFSLLVVLGAYGEKFVRLFQQLTA